MTGGRTSDEGVLRRLVGLKISAVCFVGDHVELGFDGPVLRALSYPFGLYGCHGWRFPEGNSPTFMRYFIGKTVDDVVLVPDRLLAVDSGEHRFAIPLDPESRRGPDAAHLLVPDDDASGGHHRWTW